MYHFRIAKLGNIAPISLWLEWCSHFLTFLRRGLTLAYTWGKGFKPFRQFSLAAGYSFYDRGMVFCVAYFSAILSKFWWQIL